MRRTRLLWRLYPPYLIITVVALLGASWIFARAARRFHVEQTSADLEVRARLLEVRLGAPLAEGRLDEVQRLCTRLGHQVRTRITVIRSSGVVVADSDQDPAGMDNHADRPETREALTGRVGTSTRFSHTLGEMMRYVAVPVGLAEGAGFVLRTAMPMTAIEEALDDIFAQIALGGVTIALLAAMLSLLAARRITRPLERMQQVAARFAAGDFAESVGVSGAAEIDALAGSLNQMAAQLQERFATITQQREEARAVLTSMADAVLAIDAEERLIVLNAAAEALLDVERAAALGRPLLEAVRNLDLQRFLSDLLVHPAPHQGEITLAGEEPLYLQLSGTVLQGPDGTAKGALVVLNDVTRLRKLEQIRKEFVANVSHELKTPIASIQGAVETLAGGALERPGDAERFVDIIARHTKRLNAIIDDLLQLARIEQQAERGEMRDEETGLGVVLRTALENSADRAATKKIALELDCPAELRAPLEPRLLERAVANLIDNAINYSDPGQTVQVRAGHADDEITIAVVDQGCGIPAEHHERVFERFYRVDPARSRTLGGTGLGLSIVKHIAEAHGGRVDLESTPGAGSVFRIQLPART